VVWRCLNTNVKTQVSLLIPFKITGMKSTCLLIILVVPGYLSAQTTTQNYLVTSIPYQTVSDPTSLSDVNSNSTIQYFDGLGRLSQTIQKAITPAGQI